MSNKTINLANFSIANHLPFTLFAGPCQIESEEQSLQVAEELQNITSKLGINFVFKSSFDKANRTSINGKRGVGLEKALKIFEKVKSTVGCPIVTDVHTEEQCAEVAKVADVLQIPALLCRQTDLILAAANTGKIVKIKKGQFMAPWDVASAVEKAQSTGNNEIIVTERGTSFGYNRLITDMRSLKIMGEKGTPVVFDATHSVQEPSALNGSSGGQREFVEILARAAISIGIAGLFVECHPNPDEAFSDGPCMVKLSNMQKFLEQMKQFDNLAKSIV